MFNTVFANDVQQTLDHFRRSVDQLLGNSFGNPDSSQAGTKPQSPAVTPVFSPAIESGWNENEMCVRAVLPGVQEKDIQVSIRGHELILEGERKAPETWTRAGSTQLAYGPFYAAVSLPQGLNLEKVACRLHNGLLDISIPIAEQMKPRQIPIQTEGTQRAISA
jgi:HSP20 family protein